MKRLPNGVQHGALGPLTLAVSGDPILIVLPFCFQVSSCLARFCLEQSEKHWDNGKTLLVVTKTWMGRDLVSQFFCIEKGMAMMLDSTNSRRNFFEIIIQVVADECDQFYEAQNHSSCRLSCCSSCCNSLSVGQVDFVHFLAQISIAFRSQSEALELFDRKDTFNIIQQDHLMAEVEEAMEDAR